MKGGAGDDENQEDMDNLVGRQTYALNLPGGGSVTLDWLVPEALPFFMGVQAMESFGEEGLTADTISGAFASISEPMLEMSMLQSLNDLLDNVSYAARNEKLQGIVGSALISYLNQAIPTFLGQVERSMEDICSPFWGTLAAASWTADGFTTPTSTSTPAEPRCSPSCLLRI